MPGIVRKFKELWIPPEDDFEYEEYQDEREKEQNDNNLGKTNKIFKKQSTSESKVVNIHATAQLQVVLFKPERFGEETRTIADELIKMHTVVLNFENTSRDVFRRTLDFLSGVAYANGGHIKRVATSTYIITPYNVDLTGDDLLDELENSGVYF